MCSFAYLHKHKKARSNGLVVRLREGQTARPGD